jgi:uncharacterized protein
MLLFGSRFWVWLAGLLLLAAPCFVGAQELQPVPALTARVTDLTATLSADERVRLESKLAAFETRKGAQIAVLLVATVKPEAIEQYSIRVVDAWKLGRKGVDDGVLLLIAKQDKKLRIEVGYGLEGALNDATAKRIISETITPRFKQGDFYGGVDAGLDAVLKVIEGEPLPAPKAASGVQDTQGSSGDSLDTLLVIGFVLVFVVGGFLRALFGRFLAAGIIGGVAGVIASFIISSMLIAGIVGVVAFIISLFVGAAGGGGWSSGGGSWGGGSGSGGFSGGGGSFGGGGASGDW